MKKLIFVLSVCCILYSCTDHHHYIPQDKLPLLKNNAIVYFQDSASNKIDTFRLDVTNNWWTDSEGVDYFQNIDINYNRLNSKTIFLQYGITSASVDGANFGVDYPPQLNYDNGSTTINFSIHGATYNNVYIAHDNTIHSDTIPDTVYFTCHNGIIRYEYNDGRVYQLLNK
jgi:hypothetical protein